MWGQSLLQRRLHKLAAPVDRELAPTTVEQHYHDKLAFAEQSTGD